MKKTIEEVAEEFASSVHDKNSERLSTTAECIDWQNKKFNFIAGAKYQSEKMYSDEDLREAFEAGEKYGSQVSLIGNFNEWFNQFKKS